MPWASRQRSSSNYGIPLEPNRPPHTAIPKQAETQPATPLVSILIRSMNREYLVEALASISLQTYPNIEVVVLSVRPGHRALGSQCGPFPLRLVPTDTPVLRSAAANRAIAAAQGDYLIFLDDDDWMMPGHIARLAEVLTKQPRAQAVYTGIALVDAHGKSMGQVFDLPFDGIRQLAGNFTPIHSVLFRTNAMQQGCRFDEDLDRLEDWDFWLQLSQLAPMVHLPGVSAVYRIHESSGVHNDSGPLGAASGRIYTKWETRWTAQQVGQIMQRVWAYPEMEARIAEARAQVQIAEQGLANSQATIAQQAACIAQQTSTIQQQVSNLAQQESLTNSLLDELRGARDHLARVNAENTAMLLSSSWKLTHPLRWIGSRLKRSPLRTLLGRIRRRAFTAPTLKSVVPGAKPCSIVRNSNGRYSLSPVSQGYTYVEPQRPHNLETRISDLSNPVVSFAIVVPVYNTAPALLSAVLSSVKAQWYPHWTLILSNDASSDPATLKALSEIEHPQITVLHLPNNQGIAGATNAALKAVESDFIVFMDHDDELTVDCLYELALCIERDQPDFVYSDEDKLTEQGDYAQPHFKPDWSPDTMMSTMFTGHVSCVRSSLLDSVGELRSEFNGCQDWDFVLRVAEHTKRISHIPKVLYHWRIIPESVASDIAAKPYVLDASRRVRMDALARRGLSGSVEAVEQVPGYFRVNYHVQGSPKISIIIPSRDNGEVLRCCLESIQSKSTYRNFEIIVLDNGSVKEETLAYLQDAATSDQVAVIRHDAPFNYSDLNNIGSRHASGDILLFLNDDTEVLTNDWLERMGGYAQLPHVAAVGAKLLYPKSQKVQHAGVVNLAQGPTHAFHLCDKDEPGYFMRNLLEYNWLAVTGACLMIEASKFRAIGGFNTAFPIAYNDVDLCIRSVKKGFYNVVCQAASLIHHESVSRGLDHVDHAKIERLKDERRRLYDQHPDYYQHDPFHSPNLLPSGYNFEIPS